MQHVLHAMNSLTKGVALSVGAMGLGGLQSCTARFYVVSSCRSGPEMSS